MAETVPPLVALKDAVRQSANQPADVGAQQQIVEHREHLNKLLSRAPSDTLSPVGREVLKELKVTGLLGSQLRKRVEEILKGNKLTPTAAADELDVLAERVEQLSAALENVQNGFEHLGIGIDELEPGEVEVSFLIPRREVHDGLAALGQEFINLKRILGPFLELSTGSREDVRVRAIASSEFETFLILVPAAAAMFAKALETVLNIYEKVLNIRLARKQLEDSGIDDDYVDGLENRADDLMRREIEQFVDHLMTDRTFDDEARANELRTDMAKQTMELARRIDRGYRVDLEARELAPAEDGAEPTDRAETRAAVEAVLAARDRLKVFKLTGKPILRLPEPTDDDTSSNHEDEDGQ